MDTWLWSQRGSVFSSQLSVFSHTTESRSVLSSPRLDEFSLPWIGANGVRISWVTANSLKRNDGKVAETHNPQPLVDEMPDAAMIAWNKIRVLMAIAPFQTLVRPTCEDGCISKVVSDREASVNVSRYVGSLGRRFDPDEPELYVRPRCFAPTLGRFLPRDPR